MKINRDMGRLSKFSKDKLQMRGANLPFLERVASVLAAMLLRKRWLDMPQTPPEYFDDIDRKLAEKAIEGGDWKTLLQEYGILFPSEKQASTIGEAQKIAGEMGYPVVLKIEAFSQSICQ